MVKGCQKKTIHIKDTGSKYYEEAYFVLRPGVAESGGADSDMIGEALRIAGESVSSRIAGRKGRRVSFGTVITFVLGVLTGSAAAAVFCAVFPL